MDFYSQEMQQKKKKIYKINAKQLENGNRNIYTLNIKGLNTPTKIQTG